MKSISFWAIIISLSIVVYLDLQQELWKDRGRIIESDVKHYYAWLPAVLVYNDISLKFLDEKPDVNKDYFVDQRLEDGRLYFKTTMGVALMQGVFIAPLHYTLKAMGLPADGFSEAYKKALIIGSLFYFIAALFMIRYILLRRMKFDEATTAISLLAIGLGTNLLIYVAREPALSHIYSFFCVSLLILVVDSFVKTPTLLKALFIGIVYGMITLIRPVNGIVGLVIVLWGVSSISDLKQRLMLFVKSPLFVLVMVLGALLIWTPQLFYYKYLTGSFAFTGYNTPGGFFFDNPQFRNHLFSYRKGWFLYTPMMVLAVIGLIPLYRKHRHAFYTVISILFLLVYINSSWYSWWFGGGFGQRAYIDIYGLLVIPLAAFLQVLLSKNLAFKVIAVALPLLLIGHNLFQCKQYINGAIHYSGMTREAYWDSFGRLKPSLQFLAYIQEPDMDLALKGIYPKPVCTEMDREKWLQYIEAGFRSNPAMMKFLEEKAKANNIPLDTMVRNDAIWTYKKDYIEKEQ